MLKVKPWWHLKPPCPTSPGCCVPCHRKPASVEVHAPLFGQWKPRVGNGEIQPPNQKPQSPAHTKLPSPAKNSAQLCWWEGHHPTTPTTPQHPPPRRGQLNPSNPWEMRCIATLVPVIVAVALWHERLVLAGLFHPPAPYCLPEPGPDPGYL